MKRIQILQFVLGWKYSTILVAEDVKFLKMFILGD
jgi:hypothetical protein